MRSVQYEDKGDRVKKNQDAHYLPLSDSANTCRVEPEAECDEVTTRDLDKPTAA